MTNETHTPQEQPALNQPLSPQPPAQAPLQPPYDVQQPYGAQLPQQPYGAQQFQQPPVPPQNFVPFPSHTSLRRDIMSTCLTVLAFILTIQLGAGVLGAILMLAAEGPSNFLNETDVTSLIGKHIDLIMVAQLIAMTCGLAWFFLIRGKKFLTTDITKRNASPRASGIFELIALMFGIQFSTVLLAMLAETILRPAGLSATDSMDSSVMMMLSSPLGILYVVLIGPIIEELAFRGAVMRKLEPYGANFAIVTSSILFGLYHLILFQAVFAFFAGLIFAYAAGRYSLKWALLLHILNNLLATLTVLLPRALTMLPQDAAEEIVGMGFIALYFVGFVVAIVLLVAKRDSFKAQKVAGAPVLPRVFKTAYSHPAFIVYVSLTVLFGLVSVAVGL